MASGTQEAPIIRFLAKISLNKETGCWEWIGGKNRDGYATLSENGHTRGAHRFAYEFYNKTTIPKDLEIDHLCRNQKCVNPAHLELVTRLENIMRGVGPELLRQFNSLKTHCPHGHSYNEENTYVNSKGGRVCRTCLRKYQKYYRAHK